MVHSYIEMETHIIVTSFMNLRCNKAISLYIVNSKNNVFIKKSILFIISLTWKNFLLIIYSYMVYILIKQYINNFIYTSISSYFVAFVLVLICGICVSCLTNRLFEHLVNKWKNTFWDKYVLATLIDLSISYFNSLSCNNALCFVGYQYENNSDDENYSDDKYGIVKVFAWQLEAQAKERIRRGCLSWEIKALSDDTVARITPDTQAAAKNASLTYHRIKRLEPIAAALGREKDDKNVALHDVVTEHIDSSKQELCTFMKEATTFAYAHKATKQDVMFKVSKWLNGLHTF